MFGACCLDIDTSQIRAAYCRLVFTIPWCKAWNSICFGMRRVFCRSAVDDCYVIHESSMKQSNTLNCEIWRLSSWGAGIIMTGLVTHFVESWNLNSRCRPWLFSSGMRLTFRSVQHRSAKLSPELSDAKNIPIVFQHWILTTHMHILSAWKQTIKPFTTSFQWARELVRGYWL